MGVRPALLTCAHKSTRMDNDLNATYEACNNFNNKLKDTLLGLINANNDRKSEIDGLRSDHDQLRKDHDAFVVSMERENDLRKNEIKSLEVQILQNSMASLTLKTMQEKRKSRILTRGQNLKMTHGSQKLQIWTTSRTLKMMLEKQKLQILTILQRAKMMEGKQILLH